MKKTLQDIENWRKIINAIKQDSSEEDAFKLDDLKCKEAEDKPKHRVESDVKRRSNNGRDRKSVV